MASWHYRCEFAEVLARIPTRDPTYAAFREACDQLDPYLLASWLSQTGLHVTGRDIKQHRRRECGCPT